MTHLTDQIETYLTFGLSPDERSAFEAHLATCEACANELAEARAADAAMKELFAADRPSADFEDRMIQAISMPHPWLSRPIVHPMVRRAAVGIAASLMIAGIGYVVNGGLNAGRLPGMAFLEPGERSSTVSAYSKLRAASASDRSQLASPITRPVELGGITYFAGVRLDDPRLTVPGSIGRTAAQGLDVAQRTQAPMSNHKWLAIGNTGAIDEKSHFGRGIMPAAGKPDVFFDDRSAVAINKTLGDIDIKRVEGKDGAAGGRSANLSLNWAETGRNYAYSVPPQESAQGMTRGGTENKKAEQGLLAGAGGEKRLPADSNDSYLLPTDDTYGSFEVDKSAVERLKQSQNQAVTEYYGLALQPAGDAGAKAEAKPKAQGQWDVAYAADAKSAPADDGRRKDEPGIVLAATPGELPSLHGDIAVTNGAVPAPMVASTPAKGPVVLAGVEAGKKVTDELSDQIKAGGGGAGSAQPAGPGADAPTKPAQDSAGVPASDHDADKEAKVAETDLTVRHRMVINEATSRLPVAQADVKARLADGDVKGSEEFRERALLDRHTVQDLQQTADKLVEQGKIKEAEGVVAQIHQLDPAAPDAPKPNPADPVALPVQPAPPPAHQAPAAVKSKIIRTGEMDFEVESFEVAVSTITKVVEEEGGYVSTTNSDKLPNGKVKGTVVMRVTPDRLDTLVLKLRGIGDLKTQNIHAQDITKEYTDLESRLRAAQIMCDQILDIIKSGKAAVKDLLEAEKQLGVYREKVEQLTGEINFYANQISLSTLTLTLFERDIRTPALASETETVTMTLVTEKVDEAAVKAKDAIAAAKGRIVASQQAQTDEGQSTATIKAQVPPDKAEEVIAKLKQIEGQLDHFDRQRSQTTSNGSSPVDPRTADPVKVKREDVTIDLTLYNLAKLTPRRRTDLSLAAVDVDEAKRSLEEQVRAAGGRIIDSRTEYPRPDQKKGDISFDVPTEKADALIATLKGLGETLQISTVENPSAQGVTESKRGFAAVIYDMASVQPRRQTTLTLITPTVDQSQASLADQVKAAGGRVIGRKIEHPTADQSVGILAFELPTAKADAFLAAMKPVGEMLQVTTSDNNAAQNVTDSKRGFQITLLDLAGVLPRRVTSLTLVTNTVDTTEAALVDQIRQAGGRVIARKIEHPAPDQSIGNLSFEVPTDKADALLAAVKLAGETLQLSTADNTGAPIVTDAKRGFGITLRSLTTFNAREVEQVTLASANVRDAYNDLRGLVHTQSGRVLAEHLKEEDSSNSVGDLEFEISRDAAVAIDHQMDKDGQVVSRSGERRPNADDTIDSKVHVRLIIQSAEQLPPRQISTMGIEVSDVQHASDDLGAAVLSAGGRQVDNPAITQGDNGQTTSTVQYDLPLSQIQAMADKVDGMGLRKSRQTSIDTHAPEGKLARARLTVTFSTPATLSSSDDSIWSGVRRGLVTSLRVLSYSMTLIIIGLCVVVPFGLVFWSSWRGVKWMRKTPQPIGAVPSGGE